MNDRSLIRTIENLTRRIERLEQQNRFTTATDWMPGNWWGRVSPTNPASRIVNVHGGFLWYWYGGYGGDFRQLPNTIYDFSFATAFAIGGGYRWCVLQAAVADNPPTLELHEGEEFASLADCQDDFYANGPGDGLYSQYIPLSALILRDNGSMEAGSIENVTLSDQSKSHFLVRDFRPWLHLHYTSPG